MASEIKYLLNNTQGEELDLPCVKCTGKTSHKVLASVDIRGSEGDQAYSFDWSTDNQIVQCQGCKTISFRVASTNSEDYFHTNQYECEYVVSENLYPSRIDGIKGLGDATHYLPSNVKRIYDETLHTLSNQLPVLAAIGLRALLETICKEKNAEGKQLLNKIDDLVTKGILTPVGAAILHQIRSLGNAAAHEVKPHSDKQLALAMDIIEHLLKDVYILPKQVEIEFKNKS